jgi:hypothetical protein
MAAYGLYSHIQSNKRRSIALLIGLFFLVYVLVYAGAVLGEALTINAPLDVVMRRAVSDAVSAGPDVATAVITSFRIFRRRPSCSISNSVSPCWCTRSSCCFQ